MIAFIRIFPFVLLLIGGCVGTLIALLARPSPARDDRIDDLRARVDALERKP